MKLRNKKTGEIVEATDFNIMSDYNSLAEFNEEWEDVPEEPKEYWYIDYDGGILCSKPDKSSAEKMMISMGNHFESLEEAEKAVEKLKAWKRLKDNGFRFIGLGNDRYGVKDIKYRIDPPTGFEENEGLHLLFGGEE